MLRSARKNVSEVRSSASVAEPIAVVEEPVDRAAGSGRRAGRTPRCRRRGPARPGRSAGCARPRPPRRRRPGRRRPEPPGRRRPAPTAAVDVDGLGHQQPGAAGERAAGVDEPRTSGDRPRAGRRAHAPTSVTSPRHRDAPRRSAPPKPRRLRSGVTRPWNRSDGNECDRATSDRGRSDSAQVDRSPSSPVGRRRVSDLAAGARPPAATAPVAAPATPAVEQAGPGGLAAGAVVADPPALRPGVVAQPGVGVDRARVADQATASAGRCRSRSTPSSGPGRAPRGRRAPGPPRALAGPCSMSPTSRPV